MRYDSFIRAIEQAKERYESAVRALIQDASKEDFDVEGVVRSLVKKPVKKARKTYTRKKLHWTQRPENKSRMIAQLKKAKKAAQAKKRAIKRANTEHDNG
jgi:hypothetical protein